VTGYIRVAMHATASSGMDHPRALGWLQATQMGGPLPRVIERHDGRQKGGGGNKTLVDAGVDGTT